MSDMKVGNIKLSRPDGTKLFLGAVLKSETSFPGNGLLLLGIPKENESGFRKIVSMVTEDGEVITLDGYINIAARL